MYKVVSIITILISLLIFVIGQPVYNDLEIAAADDQNGRVQIKVYRGPTEYGDGQQFAPWGYWVKQPADEHQG